MFIFSIKDKEFTGSLKDFEMCNKVSSELPGIYGKKRESFMHFCVVSTFKERKYT